MLANRWRRKLIGSRQAIAMLRRTTMYRPPKTEYDSVIMADLTRTYPLDQWFMDHMDNIATVLNLYAYTNSGMGYAQGMAFIVFVLYKTFYEDDPEYAIHDTYYAFHRVVEVIRPIYPLGSKDSRPHKFKDSVKQLIYVKLAIYDMDLAQKLKSSPDIIPIVIFQSVPALFANKFSSIEETSLLFDFIFCDKPIDTLHSTVCVLCAILLRFRHIFMSMSFEKTLELIQVKEYYNVRKIIAIASRVK